METEDCIPLVIFELGGGGGAILLLVRTRTAYHQHDAARCCPVPYPA